MRTPVRVLFRAGGSRNFDRGCLQLRVMPLNSLYKKNPECESTPQQLKQQTLQTIYVPDNTFGHDGRFQGVFKNVHGAFYSAWGLSAYAI